MKFLKFPHYYFLLAGFLLLTACDNSESDIINVEIPENPEVDLDSIMNLMVGSYRVQLKRTPLDPQINTLADELYTYNADLEIVLGNKLRLTSSYTDIGDDLNEHELDLSVAKVAGDNVFLAVDPLWNYLEPFESTYQATGTGSYFHDDQEYDGVFDLSTQAFELKFEGTVSGITRLYIISSD